MISLVLGNLRATFEPHSRQSKIFTHSPDSTAPVSKRWRVWMDIEVYLLYSHCSLGPVQTKRGMGVWHISILGL